MCNSKSKPDYFHSINTATAVSSAVGPVVHCETAELVPLAVLVGAELAPTAPLAEFAFCLYKRQPERIGKIQNG
jgi:hypothetical protein